MGLLEGKAAAIFGVANQRSIAWAIVQSMAREGARIALSYQGARQEEDVRKLARSLKDPVIFPCDVTSDEDITAAFRVLREKLGRLDGLVHSIAFARKEELEGSFLNVSREGFRITNDVSTYSLIALTREAVPLMGERGGSILTLSFLGGWRVVPNYNVMGVAKAALETSVRYLANELGIRNIRVNGISAGPINTVAARGIGNFSALIDIYRQKAPMRRSVEGSEVGDAAVFLASDLARGITGEILYVDAGYHVTS